MGAEPPHLKRRRPMSCLPLSQNGEYAAEMVRSGARPSALRARNADAFEDLDHLWCVAPLAGRVSKGDRPAAAFTREVDLAGQTALGASESLIGAVLAGVFLFRCLR